MAGAGSLAGRRVLIVEDRFLLAEHLRAEVEGLGAIVLGPCRNMAQAEALLADPIDLAILDVHLEGETVYPLAGKLRASGAPILFLTGYSGEVIPAEWRDCPRLEKPLNSALLAQTAAALVKP